MWKMCYANTWQYISDAHTPSEQLPETIPFSLFLLTNRTELLQIYNEESKKHSWNHCF